MRAEILEWSPPVSEIDPEGSGCELGNDGTVTALWPRCRSSGPPHATDAAEASPTEVQAESGPEHSRLTRATARPEPAGDPPLRRGTLGPVPRLRRCLRSSPAGEPAPTELVQPLQSAQPRRAKGAGATAPGAKQQAIAAVLVLSAPHRESACLSLLPSRLRNRSPACCFGLWAAISCALPLNSVDEQRFCVKPKPFGSKSLAAS